ncbi:TPA: very short patch repair endonuclease [Pseudomonas aeruginosa]|uniref:very short patch repair endonuclease n=1 Tax=Pseudomonas aeruginosa TaxID=287 RepID=UPI001CD3E640|nr:very short patch repair endonuclease [Pseudomonas aeruginosa]MCS9387192.1 very short patch repair endonuclease [Pseudomonas aeruginosa]MDG9836379.1 very short patch repair endonuclease [Pseudomonas aeruginosa]MDH0456238.1 very short patch repair endonuclease [Pseudomonas aeruginosa]MDH0588907.1 very short patch repair endonuclease [Pseudomonas aeruginosa]UTQ15364.1 very short patch repair endonuclease [Pseudomonas aeruginosa]
MGPNKMDRLSVEQRSRLMSRVKGKNTAPELVVRRLVFGMGYRYRLHLKNLPGRPDLAFLGRKKVIFVNGCFWHGHTGCRYGQLPKTRLEYWQDKIERNKKRDEENIYSLETSGWQVLTIWQCELRNIEHLREKLSNFMGMDQ